MSTKPSSRPGSPVTRRTMLKAGAIAGTSPLWVPPVLSVLGLSPDMAQAASVPTPTCITTYPSHAFLVFSVPTVSGSTSTPTYYVFKFGDGTSAAPTPGDYNQPKDGAFLAATAPYSAGTIIGKSNQGTAAQQVTRTQLLAGIQAATFAKSSGTGYTIVNAPSSLVGVFAYDGSFSDNIYQVHSFAPVNGQYLITKCA